MTLEQKAQALEAQKRDVMQALQVEQDKEETKEAEVEAISKATATLVGQIEKVSGSPMSKS